MARNLVVVAVLAVALSACVDSAKRFDEFEDTVIDAAVVEEIDAAQLDQLPDITGTFYLALTLEVAPAFPFQFRGDYELTRNPDGTGSLDIAMSALSAAERVPVGDPLWSRDNVVNSAGQFRAPFQGTVDGSTNPLTGAEAEFDLVLVMTIQSEDVICGISEGLVTKPIELDITGSPAIALRTAPDATGDDLPAPTAICPEVDTPDAGPGADAAAGDPDAA